MGVCNTKPKKNPDQIDLTHFEVGITLGRGGFGKVHAVQCPPSQEWMAMKRMGKAIILQRHSMNLVWSEREIMMGIQKSGSHFLCGLVHAFQSDKEVFIVTQFMQGGDFTYQISQQPNKRFPEDSVRFYIAEMVSALEVLHQLGFLYRDLKPENILLDLQGHIRFSDFGLSCKLDSKQNYTTNLRAGTPGYMAPELLRGMRYGFPVDIYSLGCTMYELLHGRLPVPASTVANLSRAEAMQSSLFEFSCSSSLSTDCADLITHMLAVNPKDRISCAQIKEHKWFVSVDWKLVMDKKLKAPVIPNPDRPNVDMMAEANDQLLDQKPQPIADDQQHHFEGWEYNISLSPTADQTYTTSGPQHRTVAEA